MKYLADDGYVIIQVQQSTKSTNEIGKVWHCAGLFEGVFTGVAYQTLLSWRLKSGHLRQYFYLKPTDAETADALAQQVNGPAPNNNYHPGRFYNSGIRGSEVKIQTVD
jgi:hypothetical protein